MIRFETIEDGVAYATLIKGVLKRLNCGLEGLRMLDRAETLDADQRGIILNGLKTDADVDLRGLVEGRSQG